MPTKVKAVRVNNLTHPWAIADANDLSKILDDAQGYGYRTPQKAHAAWNYKHRSKKSNENRKKAGDFWKHHKSLSRDLSDMAFEIAKGSWEPDDKFDYNFFKSVLTENKIDTQGIPMRTLWSVYMRGK